MGTIVMNVTGLVLHSIVLAIIITELSLIDSFRDDGHRKERKERKERRLNKRSRKPSRQAKFKSNISRNGGLVDGVRIRDDNHRKDRKERRKERKLKRRSRQSKVNNFRS